MTNLSYSWKTDDESNIHQEQVSCQANLAQWMIYHQHRKAL